MISVAHAGFHFGRGRGTTIMSLFYKLYSNISYICYLDIFLVISKGVVTSLPPFVCDIYKYLVDSTTIGYKY